MWNRRTFQGALPITNLSHFVYSQWLQTFRTAEATISGYESIHMIRKGQIEGIGRNDILYQKMFMNGLFGIAA